MTNADKQVAALREAAQFALDWLTSDTNLTPKEVGARFHEVKSRLRGALAACQSTPEPVAAPGAAEAWLAKATARSRVDRSGDLLVEGYRLMRAGGAAPPAPARDQALRELLREFEACLAIEPPEPPGWMDADVMMRQHIETRVKSLRSRLAAEGRGAAGEEKTT